MKKKIREKLKSFSHFLWLVCLIIISIFVTYFYDSNQKSQYANLKKTLGNVYFKKSIAKLTSELEKRYTEVEYEVKEGDNFESIIERVEISKNEKKLFLETVKKDKKLKILIPRQKIFFKIDKKGKYKIAEFKIEISKKEQIYFVRDLRNNNFRSKI